MSNREVGEYIYNITDTTEVNVYQEGMLKGYTLDGNWEEVKKLYNLDPKFSTIEINKSRGTALHVAVNDGNEEVVKNLVNSILSHKNEEEALACKNEKGDTPLHLAASRGFKDICECIIGKGGERKHLNDIDNSNGESPLFLAALSWQKQTFDYLIKLKPGRSDCGGNYSYARDLIRSNGDSILHCAIRREFFDLALIIIYKYPDLVFIQNKFGFSPLQLLATRPSAFKSGYKMIWWKKILYHCIPGGTQNVDEGMKLFCQLKNEPKPQESCPKNYDTCYLFINKCREYAYPLICFAKEKLQKKQTTYNAANGSKNMGKKDKLLPSKCKLHPENYATCLLFLKFVYIYTLGLLGVGVEEIKKMKQKHKWSGQLLNIFVVNHIFEGFGLNPYDSYLGTGAKPIRDVSGTEIMYAFNPNQEDSKKKSTQEREGNQEMEDSTKNVEFLEEYLMMDKKLLVAMNDTVYLCAAKHGITEIMLALESKLKGVIHETNSDNENALLIAVKYRQPQVVEGLWKRLSMETFQSINQQVDINENTILHLAAYGSIDNENSWKASGVAMQMMWDIKWYKYIKGLGPEHFNHRSNKDGKTPSEIFQEEHKELLQNSIQWLIETTQSCSAVAAIVAGISFATLSSVPGGNKETGKSSSEEHTALEGFAISSLIGVYFSVTALILFLSILIDRKQVEDFDRNLPLKLLIGLSSVFVSIVAVFVSFCTGHFLTLSDKYTMGGILFYLYVLICLPVTLYAIVQFRLYVDLVKVLWKKVPPPIIKGVKL